MPVEPLLVPDSSPDSAPPVRIGVWLYPGQAAGDLVDAVVAADDLGLDEVWIADEGVAREPLVLLAAAARETRRVTLAVGITSPVLRHPGAIAASLATLDELSDGRALLGLGVGGHESLAPFGLTAERPVALIRDAIETARAVLGRRPSGAYQPPLHAMPARRVPIWVGARGPQLVRLAARLADGVFVSGCTPEQHDRIVADVRGNRADVRGNRPVARSAPGGAEGPADAADTRLPPSPVVAMDSGVADPNVTDPSFAGPSVTGPGVAGPSVTGPGVTCQVAVYQSVSATTSGPSISSWEGVADDLARERDRLAPTSIGLNLMDLARSERIDPVAQVRRAAEVLTALRS